MFAVELPVEELARGRVEPGQMQREPACRAAPDLHRGEVPDPAESGPQQSVGGGGPAVDLKALQRRGSCHGLHGTTWGEGEWGGAGERRTRAVATTEQQPDEAVTRKLDGSRAAPCDSRTAVEGQPSERRTKAGRQPGARRAAVTRKPGGSRAEPSDSRTAAARHRATAGRQSRGSRTKAGRKPDGSRGTVARQPDGSYAAPDGSRTKAGRKPGGSRAQGARQSHESRAAAARHRATAGRQPRGTEPQPDGSRAPNPSNSPKEPLDLNLG
ncbi:hypothetical protein GCM10009837_29270 [Streptomyces durmitorensis]